MKEMEIEKWKNNNNNKRVVILTWISSIDILSMNDIINGWYYDG